MNTRIKELADQAKLNYIMTPANPYISEDLQNFAELIIKECAQVGRGIGGINVSDAIKKKFGVE